MVYALAGRPASVKKVYAYSPYGEATALGPDGGNSLQYTGRENDGSGLYYYRARYYDPILKQWISEDPIGSQGGPNFYAYVDGNSVSNIDPFGLFKLPKQKGWPAQRSLQGVGEGEKLLGKLMDVAHEQSVLLPIKSSPYVIAFGTGMAIGNRWCETFDCGAYGIALYEWLNPDRAVNCRPARIQPKMQPQWDMSGNPEMYW